MRNKFTRLLASIALFISQIPQAQDLVSSEYLGLTTTTVINFLGSPFPVEYDVEYYKLVYTTIDTDGEPTVASGAIAVPVTGECNTFPITAYCHGTVLRRFNVPSELDNLEGILLRAFASAGYIVVAPDYLGLGENEGVHPYVHAESQATATIDLISAARQFLQATPVQDNGEVFVTGYSQGGHAAMATLKYAQDNGLSDDIGIVAGAPCSGPYHMSGAQSELILSDDPYSNPGYIVYLLIGYQSVYGNLYNELSDVLVDPYADEVVPFFDGEQDEFGMDAVNAILPDLVSEFMRDSVLTNFETNPGHPLRVALEDNDNHDWSPNMPLRMYYCDGDEQVFFQNSITAEANMIANGADDVASENVLPGADHGDCVIPAVEAVYAFFDSLATDCTSSLSTTTPSKNPIRLAPNPAVNEVRLAVPFQDGLIELYDINGKRVLETRINSFETRLDVSFLPAGSYVVSVLHGSARYNTLLIKK
jgi:pimeloyl-ACP methyl ester carboxylesterase